MKKNRPIWLALLLIGGFVALGWLTLPDYGMTWDEALGDFFFGDRYYAYFTHGYNPRYLQFDEKVIHYYHQPGQVDFERSPWRTAPQHYWPVTNMIVATFGDLLNRKFGCFDPIDARHAGVVFLAGLTLAGLWSLGRELFGVRAAALAVLMLAAHPQFWGHAHNNPKDIGECAFYTWSLIAVYRLVSRGHWRWGILAGLSLGCALGTKLNAIFIAVTLAPWLVIWAFAQRKAPAAPRKYLLVKLATVPIIAVALYFASWPWLWEDTWSRLQLHWSMFFERATERPSSVWQIYPFWQTAIATPPVMSILTVVGLIVLFTCKDYRRIWPAVALVLAWFAVPLLRSMPPSILNFDGIRHFIEFLPAMALIAAVGGLWVWARLDKLLGKRARHLAGAVVIASATVPAIWNDVASHPFETAHVNALGRSNLLWQWEPLKELLYRLKVTPDDCRPVDYWANSYRQACNWLNQNAPPDSIVQATAAGHILDLAGPVWLLPDLRVKEFKLDEPIDPSTTCFVLFLQRPGWDHRFQPFLEQNSTKVHEISLYGYPLLSIHRLR